MDLFSNSSVALAATLSAFLVLLSLLYRLTKSNGRLPPGPTPAPLFGTLYLLYGQSMSAMYAGLVEKYGDIFTMYIGRNRAVVLNSYDIIKEALLTKGDDFGGRPTLVASAVYPRNSGVLLSEGEVWRFHRRFSLRHLKDFGFGKRSYEGAISRECEHFLDAVRQKNGAAFDVRLLLNNAVSNLICFLTFNTRYDYGNEEFQKLTDQFTQGATTNPLLSFMLINLRFIPLIGNGIRRRVEGLVFIRSVCKRYLQEHEDSFDPANLRDLTDAYIKEKYRAGCSDAKVSGKDTDNLSDIQITKTIHDIFGAGTETTSTALRWALLFMMKHDDIQSKVRSEIDRVVGNGRRPQLADRGHMHYTEAVIAEVLRLANIIPRGGLHKTLRDTVLRGYEIPAGTTIIPNQTAVHMNEDTFPEPRMFRPERFLDEHGVFNKDLADKTIPFGIGTRVCIGESLAKMEMFLFFTQIIQQFKITPPDGGLPDIEEPKVEGLVNAPPNYKLCALPC